MSESTPVKLVLLGDSGVGKTSIVTQYISGNAPENVNPTIGAAFITKEITIDDNQVELLIWDTAGQEVYRGLAPMYYRSARIAFIVFDVTKSESFESVKYWVKELRTNVEENIEILICGNKVDLEDKREVDYQEAQIRAEESEALYAETSAATGQGIEKMFQLAISNYIKKQALVTTAAESAGVSLNAKAEQKKGCC